MSISVYLYPAIERKVLNRIPLISQQTCYTADIIVSEAVGRAKVGCLSVSIII